MNKVGFWKSKKFLKIDWNQGRKAAEARCQQLDEQLELNEVSLIEARQVAEDSNHKYEEAARKGN